MNKLGRSFSFQKTGKKNLFQRRMQRNSGNNVGQLGDDGAKAESSSTSSRLSLNLHGSMYDKSHKPTISLESPMLQLQSGTYDLDLRYVNSTPTTELNDLQNTERRINEFLEQEMVHTVRVSDYLKDLSVYTETQKYL